MFEAARTFIRLAGIAEKLMSSGGDWQTIYDLIFSDEISGAIRATEIPFEHTSPDLGYEEDVRAFVGAVVEKALKLEKVINVVNEHTLDIMRGESNYRSRY